MSRHPLRVLLVLVAVVVMAYGILHVRSAEWVYEDGTWINGGAREWGEPMWYAYFMPSTATTIRTLPNRHLTMWTFYLTPHSRSAVSAHAVNVVIHVLCVLLLYALLVRWVSQVWAAMAAIIFLVDPMTSEAVAYAGGRPELLTALFTLACAFCVFAYDWPKAIRWPGFVLAFLCGCASKPTFVAAILPLLCWLLVFWRPSLPRLKLVVACLAPIVAVAAAYVVMRKLQTPVTIPLVRWFAVQSVAVWSLAFASVGPLHLSIDHAWWAVPLWVQIAAGIGALLMFLVILPLAWALERAYGLTDAKAYLALGVGWWWLAWLPRLLVRDPLGWIHEHHAYTPSIGLAIAAASVLYALCPTAVSATVPGNSASLLRDCE